MLCKLSKIYLGENEALELEDYEYLTGMTTITEVFAFINAAKSEDPLQRRHALDWMNKVVTKMKQ